MLIDKAKSALLVVDIQDKLAPLQYARESMEANVALLLKGAAALDVPVLVSEQYPKGLGHTVSGLTGLFRDDVVIAKTAFSCARDGIWKKRFDALGRAQAVICGIEAHVCVLQTAMELKAVGTEVFVAADAVTSRTQANRDLGIARMRENGIQIVSAEMVLFEWMGEAGTPEFKTVSALLK
jgi:nicotinamidase-related amidase